MKKAILGIALLTSLTTLSYAGEIRKAKKATTTNCEKTPGQKGATHACCMKKAQA